MKDKVIIITGGSRGIGQAISERFCAAGSKVVFSGRDEAQLKAVEEAIKAKGGECMALVSDVTKQAECQKLIDLTLEKYGRIDVLVNNAGISMRAMFNDAEVEVLEKLMQVNFWGSVYCTKAALPHILKSKGSIASISSIAGYRGLPARSGYSASKFALQGFMESLRTELLQSGVHVLVACPGFTQSNIRKTALDAGGGQQGESPLDEGKIMTAEEVADYIYKAIINRKRDLILTSQGKLTIFLNKWLPGFMDKMVFKHFAKEPDSPLKKAK